MKKYLVMNKADEKDIIIVCETKKQAKEWVRMFGIFLNTRLAIKEATVNFTITRTL